VADTVDGLVKAAGTEGIEGETIHLGTGQMVSIAELFRVCCATLDTDAQPRLDERRLRPGRSEVLALLSDPARARTRLAWTSQISLEDGVRRTAQWVREHLHLFDDSRFHV
jgi:nucleoside-diphosphate-sugar epimerase